MVAATGITIRIELAGAAQRHVPWQIPGSALAVDGPAGTTIAITVTLHGDPPSGEVQLGTLRWRFANRVEMLEAIDAACEEATRAGAQQPTFGGRP